MATSSRWDDALKLLDEDDRRRLQRNASFKVNDLLADVKNREQEASEKKLTAKTKHGEIVIFRVSYARIARAIERGIDFGNWAAQLDPVHLALPWAAVKFLLQASVLFYEQRQAILDGIECVSEIAAWGKQVEETYLSFDSKAAAELHKGMVSLYQKCLAFLAKACKYKDEHGMGNAVAAFFHSLKGFTEPVDAIKAQREFVTRYANVAIDSNQLQVAQKADKDRESLLEVLNELKRPITYTETAAQDALQSANRSECDKALEWVSGIKYQAHHADIFQNVMQGSGKWMFENPAYLEWQNSNRSQLLWLHGGVGSGKTCLTSLVAEKALQQTRDYHEPLPAYFYCTRNTSERERGSSYAILKCILRQLSTKEAKDQLPDIIRARFDESNAKGDLTSKEVSDMLSKLVGQRSVTTIVVDALDECDGRSRLELVKVFNKLLAESTSLVKVFVSSREDPALAAWLKAFPTLEVDSSYNTTDIVRYVSLKIDEARKEPFGTLFPGDPIPEILAEEVKDTLRTNAQGMFRWVDLQIQIICDPSGPLSVEDLRTSIQASTLPEGLQESYNLIYVEGRKTLKEYGKIVSDNLFHWLLCSFAVLTPERLCTAVSAGITEKPPTVSQLVQYGFNLVRHDKETDVMRFEHQSVADYLTADLEETYNKSTDHAAVACICLRILLNEDPDETDPKPHTAYGYASLFWGPHALKAGQQPESADLHKLLHRFLLGDNRAYARWNDCLLRITEIGSWPWHITAGGQHLNYTFGSLLTTSLPPQPLLPVVMWNLNEHFAPCLERVGHSASTEAENKFIAFHELNAIQELTHHHSNDILSSSLQSSEQLTKYWKLPEESFKFYITDDDDIKVPCIHPAAAMYGGLQYILAGDLSDILPGKSGVAGISLSSEKRDNRMSKLEHVMVRNTIISRNRDITRYDAGRRVLNQPNDAPERRAFLDYWRKYWDPFYDKGRRRAFSDSSGKIELQDSVILTAYCADAYSKLQYSTISLNDCLCFKDGDLCWKTMQVPGTLFSTLARNVRIEKLDAGCFLYADMLLEGRDPIPVKINLDAQIGNVYGKLRYNNDPDD